MSDLMDKSDELVEKLYDDSEDISEIVDLFNLNLRKKEIARSYKLSDVQDKLVDKISDRVENESDTFTNKELLDYHKVIQDTLDRQDKTLDGINMPVQINQQINVSSESQFNRDSRKRILDAVNTILENNDNSVVIDVEGEE